MADNAARLEHGPALYYPYLEPAPGHGKGLLSALADQACVVVTDDFPGFFLPRMVTVAAERLTVRLETVDSNGLLPVRLTDRAFPTAYSFRRYVQKTLPAYLGDQPLPDPVAGSGLPRFDHALVSGIFARWPPATPQVLNAASTVVASMPLDHSVPPASCRGGSAEAETRLRAFLRDRLPAYAQDRNHPDGTPTSGLSPYLHFGHLSAHQGFHELMALEGWSEADLSSAVTGKRTGWWGVSEPAEEFLDQLITWRELGYGFAANQPDYDTYASLPDWARKTLEAHRNDPRPYIYSLEQLRDAATHDTLWNAAQRQLVSEGTIHSYLRMLWGKKILEWTRTPEQALDVMIELNNRYALDGRNPNSYSGIFWVLGRFDRAWGPERPVYGKVRYMSSQNAARKLRLSRYRERFGPN
jgi:deoxyribodipyrimidine photo-lyase